MIMMMCGIGAIGAILPALYPAQASIIFILMMSGIWGFGFPFVQNAINKHAEPARRATILSTLGLLISLMFIPASLMIGYFDEVYDIKTSLMFLAGQLFLLSFIGFYFWNKGIQEKQTLDKI
jgi:cyanate permease